MSENTKEKEYNGYKGILATEFCKDAKILPCYKCGSIPIFREDDSYKFMKMHYLICPRHPWFCTGSFMTTEECIARWNAQQEFMKQDEENPMC